MNTNVGCPTEVSEIESLIQRVERAHKGLNETISVMQATADRVLGSLPEQPSPQNEHAKHSNNLISEFNSALDLFEADLDRAKALANRLSRL